MKVATAFSGGFGSVEFALKYLGIEHEIVFACEWMKPQRESYLFNHGNPTCSFYEDIRNLDGEKYKGTIDYYHLSPPCQSYSMAGSRGGADDERGGLMFEAIKSIDQVQPKMFSVENVRGLLSSNNGEDWKNILRDFKSLKGYTISWGIMNAKEQGTPQNRERVFIVGFRGQAPQISFPPRVQLNKVLKDVLEDEVDEKYFLSQEMMDKFIALDIEKNNKIINDSIDKIGFINQDTQASSVFSVDGISASLCAGTHGYAQGYIKEDLVQVGNIDQQGHNSLWGRVYDTNGIAPTQNAKGGGAGAKGGLFLIKPIQLNVSDEFGACGNDGDIAYCLRASQPNGIRIKSNTKCGYEVAVDGDSINLGFPNSKTRRGRVGKQVSQTLDTSCNIGIAQERIRRLTPRECARVQGDFKDMFNLKGFSDTKLYEFIGNAMDISTTKNLITRMIEHSSIVKFGEPLETSFAKSEIIQGSLF